MPLLVNGEADEQSRCSTARHYIKRLVVGDIACSRQRFIPVDKLRSYLTRERVTWLLECPCWSCKKDHSVFRRDKPPTEFIGRIVGPENDANDQRDPAKTAFALFALLISIEHPLLIIGFVTRRCSDHVLETRTPELFSIDNLRKGYCLEFTTAVGDEDFKGFASDFAESLPKFAVPRMDSGEYSIYGQDTILPFTNEQKIGKRGEDGVIQHEGAHGKVYSFEIYEEYRQFPHAKEYTKFARKELDSASELAFHLENKNLEQVTTLQDPHIVKMIKAYKHGDTFNLIFPLAKTNLDNLLRDPEPDPSNSTQGPVESRSAWDQVLGVATALGKIGGPNGAEAMFGPSDKQQFQGVHFDLKPANILINDKGTWIISDFGESTFQDTSRSTSRVVNHGGTDAYAPPEIDNLDSRFSRRYDVWSLGCIMLEVMAFVILGHEGLCGEKGLDKVRFTKLPWSLTKDHRFFCQESQLQYGKYIVKKEITDFMKSLLESERVRGQHKSRVFVETILELITEMLEPEAEHRIEIGKVIRRLRSAIDNARDHAQALDEMVAVEGERSIGQPRLSTIRIWHFRQFDWQDTRMRIFEGAAYLRVCMVLKNNTSPSQSYLTRNTAILIPRYTFREQFTSDPAIYFSSVSQEGPQEYAGLSFSFDNIEDPCFVQATLTGQRVEASFPLKNVKYQEYVSFGGRISNLLHRKVEKESAYTDLGPATVQLWSEIVEQKNGIQDPASPKEGSIRPVRMQLHQQPSYREVPVRRMVIFIHRFRKIISITMGRNWHEDNKPRPSEPPESVHFSPTKPARDPSFIASTLWPLKPDDLTSFAGIPLSPMVLRSKESQSRFECDLIGLTFRNVEIKKKFSATYRDIKEEWHRQTKEAEKQPGYRPVPYPLVPREFLGKKLQPEPAPKSPSWGMFRPQSGSNVKKSILPAKGSVPRPAPHRGGGRGGSRIPSTNTDADP
ncbi:kinase-like domain-containing protein [Tricladium varicosporioides]|nr:kinase-like domain-containing protein [Hymenoscyphus varicosporioides]